MTGKCRDCGWDGGELVRGLCASCEPDEGWTLMEAASTPEAIRREQDERRAASA